VHQFDKVELVRYELPERSGEALEELTREAETLLERLGLRYRRVRLAAGDLGISGAMTYDLEVWAPGVGKWLEVSSCTTCTDYQARRANIRFKRSQAEKPEFVHTLNGSALALPRVVAALLETHQEADGSVSLPEPLHGYVGTDRLTLPT
jgi:seryl-tRNA synthetase